MEIGLISCSKTKKEGKNKVKSLYSSSFFKKSLEYSMNNFDRTHILSAKHGILNPDDEIESYDKTLNNMSLKERKKWSEEVVSELNERYDNKTVINFLTGKKYYEFVIGKLEPSCNILMEDLGIGEKLKWLNNHLNRTLFFSSYMSYNEFPRQIMSFKEVNDRTLGRCEVAFIDSGILEGNRKIEDIVEKQRRGDIIASVDVMENVKETVENTLKWENRTKDFPKEKKVYVLQGKNRIDYLDCLKEVKGSINKIKYLGLGGLIKKNGNKLKKILTLIPELKERGYKIHVFGIGTRHASLIRRFNPTSWDTSTPVRNAISGIIYTSSLEKKSLGKTTSKERGFIAEWNGRKIQKYLDDGSGQKTIFYSNEEGKKDFSKFLRDDKQPSLNRFNNHQAQQKAERRNLNEKHR